MGFFHTTEENNYFSAEDLVILPIQCGKSGSVHAVVSDELIFL